MIYDELVPADHLLRRIAATVDFDFVSELVGDCYCLDNGRPCWDPPFGVLRAVSLPVVSLPNCRTAGTVQSRLPALRQAQSGEQRRTTVALRPGGPRDRRAGQLPPGLQMVCGP